MLWLATFVALCLLWLWIAWRYGPQQAVGAVALVGCAVPTWCRIDASGLPVDVRDASTIFALGAYCLHPKATFPWRLGWLDASMLSLLLVHLISDTRNSGWSWGYLPRIYGEWAVPYLAGRLALHDPRHINFLAPIGAAVAIVLAIGSIFEATSGLHPWEWLYGERDFDGISRNVYRWGMLRAWGCCAHPIYFGALQVLMMPCLFWVCYRMAKVRRIHFMWLLPLVVIGGIVATGSRGPLLAAIGSILFSLFVLIPRTRPYYSLAAVAVVCLAVVFHQPLLTALRRWGGERVDVPQRSVTIDEQQVPQSGTLSRLYLLRVYRDTVVRSGWIGFGTERVIGFPISVPIPAEDLDAIRKVKFIDNAYLLLAIRFGWLGAGLFATSIALSIAGWLRRIEFMPWLERPFAVFVAGALAGTAACLLTVWMPHDIGFPFLFWLGAGSAAFHRSWKS